MDDPDDPGDGEKSRGEVRTKPSWPTTDASLRQLIDLDPDPVLVIERPAGSVRYANTPARRLLGLGGLDVVGVTFGMPVVAGDRALVEVGSRRGGVHLAELRAVDAEWEGQPAVVATLHDLTPMRRMRHRVRRLERRLVGTVRRKRRFLAVLSHELRGPLSPLLHAATVLRQGLDAGDGQAVERASRLMDRQARNLSRLVDDLMVMARAGPGGLQPRREVLRLDELLATAAEVAGPAAAVGQVTLRVDPPAEPAWVNADPAWIEQALVQLLTNAIKYVGQGGTVTLSGCQVGERVELRVSDNGPGLAAGEAATIFELFRRGRAATSPDDPGGLGVGLAMVKLLVGLHDGTVSAWSPGPGQGCVFTVVLHAAAAPESPSDPLSMMVSRDPPITRTPVVGGSFPGLRILVVEDDPTTAECLAQVLQMWGYHAQVAHDGPGALEEFARFEPDVVLTDLGLPGMDGRSLAVRLKALSGEGHPPCRVVALTGEDPQDDPDAWRDSPFDAVLVKPVDVKLIEQLLRSLVASGQPICS